MTVHAFAAPAAKKPFVSFEYENEELGRDQVEIDVDYCGICHSDLSMLNNDWGMTKFPFVGGHEVSGRVKTVGDGVPKDRFKVGDKVGLGWIAGSCNHCRTCMGGSQHLCTNGTEGTIVGRHGGFADTVRGDWQWVVKLPDGVDPATAGPLFCGGLTVFQPLVQHALPPTGRAAVIGIGGLGHMALMFLRAWGVEVTAFSTSPDKEDEAKELGAHRFVNVKDKGALKKEAGRFDLIINTTNVALDWDAYVATLAPGGVLHSVGAVEGTFGVESIFPMIMGQRSLSSSPTGSPATLEDMLAFVGRHKLSPVVETFKMENINDAFEKLRSGSPRFRLVLER